MYISKQISLSLLLLTAGIVYASEEQNSNTVHCFRLYDRGVDIRTVGGDTTRIFIAPKGNTGAEIEQKYKDLKGLSAKESASIFPRSGERLVGHHVYTFEALRELMQPQNLLYVFIKKTE